MSKEDSQEFKKLIKRHAKEKGLKYTEARRDYIISHPSKYLKEKGVNLKTLVDVGTITPSDATLIRSRILDNNPFSIAIIGLTGTGKTTVMSAILNNMLEVDSRVIVLENFAEHDNIKAPPRQAVFLPMNNSGIDLDTFVNHSMRMRADIIAVDEYREHSENLLRTHYVGISNIYTVHAKDLKGLNFRMKTLSLVQDKQIHVEYEQDLVIQTYRNSIPENGIYRHYAKVIKS